MSQAMQEQQETEVVRGQVAKIIDKGSGRWQIAVQPEGSQYTRDLWTKEEPLVNSMRQQVGQWFDFLCTFSHWTNPQGQPVRSRWIKSFGGYNTITDSGITAPPPQAQPQQGYAPGVMPPQNAPQPAPAPQPQQASPQSSPPPLVPQRLPEEVKDMRIMRQCATKVAAIMLPYLPENERNLAGLEAMSEWLMRYYTGGPQMGRQNPQDGQAGQYTQAHQAVEHYGDPGPQEGQYDEYASYEGGFPQ